MCLFSLYLSEAAALWFRWNGSGIDRTKGTNLVLHEEEHFLSQVEIGLDVFNKNRVRGKPEATLKTGDKSRENYNGGSVQKEEGDLIGVGVGPTTDATILKADTIERVVFDDQTMV